MLPHGVGSALVTVRIARVYEEPEDGGEFVLVDRLWPRGLRKDDPRIDRWLKGVAPSVGLRKWYAHDPARRAEFVERYTAELADGAAAEALAELRTLAQGQRVTLVTATKDLDLSHLPALQALIGS